MAKMNVSNPLDDEGYPMSRCVDGTNVAECSAHEGAFRHFGRIRQQRKLWTNSKTGKAMEPPEYARDDYGRD